jgi:hypothetical protein
MANNEFECIPLTTLVKRLGYFSDGLTKYHHTVSHQRNLHVKYPNPSVSRVDLYAWRAPRARAIALAEYYPTLPTSPSLSSSPWLPLASSPLPSPA